MSWLSKWWKNGGREVVRDGLMEAASDKVKRESLYRLRVLLEMLDHLDTTGIRKEIERTIEYVEGL